MPASPLSVQFNEVPSSRGWVVIAGEKAEAWAVAELEWHLHRAGLSTARVVAPPSEMTAARLRQVGDWVQLETATTTPIQYSGVGTGAAAALRAATESAAAGALIWRGDRRALASVPVATGPSMVVVHLEEGRTARRIGRSAVNGLGRQGRLALLWSAEDPLDAVQSWALAAQAGRWPRAVRAVAAPRQIHHRWRIPAAVAVAGSSVLVSAGRAGAQTTHRALGSVIQQQRLGDGAGSGAGVQAAAKAPGKFAGTKVPRHQRQGDGVRAAATGSLKLTDDQGLQYFVNTNITFNTTSSASGAASEAHFAGQVAASTLNGGTVASALNDAYDGYNSLCISINGATGPCVSNGPNWTMYNQNGPASLECNDRQVVLPPKVLGDLTVSRKDYVPTDDHFIRFLNTITNNGPTAQTVTVGTGNNLGSDSNTVITGTSSGDLTASPADNWVTSFQNWSGTTSPDVRLGHVVQGPGASIPVSAISFVNADDNPSWDYVLTLQPGQTANIVNFGVGDATKAASEADSARLATLPATAVECLTPTERADIVNFAEPVVPTPTPARPTTAGTVAATPDGKGYWVVGRDGGVFSFGDAAFYGSLGNVALNAPIVGIAATPDGKGYWLVGTDGGIFTFGDAAFYGSLGAIPLNKPIVGIAATPSGKGYWLVASDGGIFTFGDAAFYGSLGNVALNAPVVGMAATPSGMGYWLVGTDGGIFTFGDAAFYGSLGATPLVKPIIGVAAAPDGHGYWLVASDGGVFTWGSAGFFGSTSAAPKFASVSTIGLVASGSGLGYGIIDSNGTTTNLGDAAT